MDPGQGAGRGAAAGGRRPARDADARPLAARGGHRDERAGQHPRLVLRRGPLVGVHLQQLAHARGRLAQQRHHRQRLGDERGRERPAVVAAAQVRPLVGQHRAELRPGQQLDRPARHDDRGAAATDAVGDRAGMVEHHGGHVPGRGTGQPHEQPVPAPRPTPPVGDPAHRPRHPPHHGQRQDLSGRDDPGPGRGAVGGAQPDEARPDQPAEVGEQRAGRQDDRQAGQHERQRHRPGRREHDGGAQPRRAQWPDRAAEPGRAGEPDGRRVEDQRAPDGHGVPSAPGPSGRSVSCSAPSLRAAARAAASTGSISSTNRASTAARSSLPASASRMSRAV